MPNRENANSFPFDKCTEENYASEFWHTHTGIGQLAQVLLKGERDLFAMLALYGDGSGEHGKGTFILAGYVASAIDWKHIEAAWCAELAASPAIQYFKASECIRHQGEFGKQFRGWSEKDVIGKRLRLATIVNNFNPRIVEVASSIRWDEYDSVIGDDVVKQMATIRIFCVSTAWRL